MAQPPQNDEHGNEWELSAACLTYRGQLSQLPEFLPHFTIPVPNAWFRVLFTAYKRTHETLYKSDVYRVATGSIVYSHPLAYSEGQWRAALQDGCFAVQVEWAERTDTLPKAERPQAAMQVRILIPNAQRSQLEQDRLVSTTQHRFLSFLRSGDPADLALHRASV